MFKNKNQKKKFNLFNNVFKLFIQRIIKEYKSLAEYNRAAKPLKIIEINHLSSIPGETKLIIQITNKNVTMSLTAAEVISNDFDLNDFTPFHANIIRQAAIGKLVNFLSLSNKEPAYKIISKKADPIKKQFIFHNCNKRKRTI